MDHTYAVWNWADFAPILYVIGAVFCILGAIALFRAACKNKRG